MLKHHARYVLAFSINNFLTAIEEISAMGFMEGLSGMLLHEIMCTAVIQS
jgi:hypothetical protein